MLFERVRSNLLAEEARRKTTRYIVVMCLVVDIQMYKSVRLETPTYSKRRSCMESECVF